MKSDETEINSNFDERQYLNANPDVAAAVVSGSFECGWEHYIKYGKLEGRKAKPNVSRNEKVLSGLKTDGLGIEIGPSHNPIVPKSHGYNVHVIDYLDKEGLQNKYAGQVDHGVNIERIEDVDFVWKGEPLSQLIGQIGNYDYIIASHVIEHIPDLIRFFQECEVLLKPGGCLSLVIPDKRFCFDYFNHLTTTGDLLDAYYESRKQPSLGQIFDHFSNACTLNNKITWQSGCVGEFSLIYSLDQAIKLMKHAESTFDYIDTHCWRFTPKGFDLIIRDLNKIKAIKMEISILHETDEYEFCVQMTKGIAVESSSRIKHLLEISSEQKNN